MTSLEQAFSDTENAAEAVLKSIRSVTTQAKALKKAGQTGNIAGIRRSRERLDEALAALRQEVLDAGASWRFTEEEERELFQSRFAEEFRAVAATKGLDVHEQDGNLVCHPTIMRLLPGERAVRLDRKKVSAVRPSWLVNELYKRQNKPGGINPARFIEILYRAYSEIIASTSLDSMKSDSGPMIRLARIYRLMTVLPGITRDYDRSNFARDLYNLEGQGPQRTRSGEAIVFSASTGTKSQSRDVFTFIGPNRNQAAYYAIRFSKRDG